MYSLPFLCLCDITARISTRADNFPDLKCLAPSARSILAKVPGAEIEKRSLGLK